MKIERLESKMIKMRVNGNKESECNECGCPYNCTAEMYDLVLCEEQFILCSDCIEKLFQKTLKASCKYNSKVKRPDDLKRKERSAVWRKHNA